MTTEMYEAFGRAYAEGLAYGMVLDILRLLGYMITLSIVVVTAVVIGRLTAKLIKYIWRKIK